MLQAARLQAADLQEPQQQLLQHALQRAPRRQQLLTAQPAAALLRAAEVGVLRGAPTASRRMAAWPLSPLHALRHGRPARAPPPQHRRGNWESPMGTPHTPADCKAQSASEPQPQPAEHVTEMQELVTE